jgi:hypothetical protein
MSLQGLILSQTKKSQPFCHQMARHTPSNRGSFFGEIWEKLKNNKINKKQRKRAVKARKTSLTRQDVKEPRSKNSMRTRRHPQQSLAKTGSRMYT